MTALSERARLVGLVLLVGTLAGCGATPVGNRAAIGPPPGPYRGSEPPRGIKLPDFTLPSYQDRLVRAGSLRGKVVLVTFLDTKCTESCPIIAGAIGEAVARLEPAERDELATLAISVQPRLDTPANIRLFLRRRHALGVLDFLIGSEQQLRPVWNRFHVLPAVDTGNADVHSADVRVFDRRGFWVSTLHAGLDLSPANLVHDIREALQSR
jgi:protein SCO1/2